MVDSQAGPTKEQQADDRGEITLRRVIVVCAGIILGLVGVAILLVAGGLVFLGIGVAIVSAQEGWQGSAAGVGIGIVACVLFLPAVQAIRSAIKTVRNPGAGRVDPADRREPGVCASCGERDVVRGVGEPMALGGPFQSRCLTCGERRKLSRAEWESLPEANAGDPYETHSERACLVRRAPFSPQRGAVTVALAVVAALLAWVCDSVSQQLYPDPNANRFILPFMVFAAVAWRVRVRYFPPPRRPGRRCVTCGYDLGHCAGERCPECGTPFDPSDVMTQAVPASDESAPTTPAKREE